MLFIERDQDGTIVAIRSNTLTAGQETASLLDPEVQAFLKASGEMDNLAHLLALSDTSVVRVLEDLIDVLIAKKLILFTDLPPAAQDKLSGRKRIRREMHGDDLMVEDVL